MITGCRMWGKGQECRNRIIRLTTAGVYARANI